MPTFAHCPRENLCEMCREDCFGFLRGTAACRGSVWALSVAKRVRARDPWPPFAGRCRSIALAKVTDLTADQRLREQLADVTWRSAARAWAHVAA